MAGHRRIPGKDPKPRRRDASPGRRRQNLDDALAQAASPADRLGAAAEYARAALRKAPDPAAAERLVADLVALGDRLNGLTKERRATA